MNPEPVRTARTLLRDVAVLQLKLLLDALRDVVLSPVTIAAAAFDLLLSRRQSPRHFHAVLRVAERTDAWIDLWSAGRDPTQPQRENVDALLLRVEEIVGDPRTGARRARVLRRWAERQLLRARTRAVEGETAAKPPPAAP